jgi:hypothetical protein
MSNVIEFPRKTDSEAQVVELMNILVYKCSELGINISDPDFVYDMAWVQRFVQATCDNQNNIANDLYRLTRAKGICQE